MTPAGIEPATFRFVAQHLNHCVTAVPQTTGETNKKSKVTSAFRLKRTRLEVTWLLYVPPDCYRILRSTILRKSFIFSCFPYYIISRIRNENWQIFTSSFLKFRVTISSTSSDRWQALSSLLAEWRWSMIWERAPGLSHFDYFIQKISGADIIKSAWD